MEGNFPRNVRKHAFPGQNAYIALASLRNGRQQAFCYITVVLKFWDSWPIQQKGLLTSRTHEAAVLPASYLGAHPYLILPVQRATTPH